MLALAIALAHGQFADLDAKVASIQPQPHEERWMEIPWRTNLMKARVESQQSGKPMFLWIMNGHPFGCT
ncbi:MAG: hypothetical protein IH944_01365 [Armatimonadetes bacterium]|nr:hypothetical protein [Armatimonadota bacterium]